MTQKEIRFNELFSEEGGIFDIHTGFHPITTQVFQNLRNYYQQIVVNVKELHPKQPDIHIDFIANDSLNGGAIKDGDQYFIGINIGSYFLINDMFNCILATKENLTYIGSPNLEEIGKKVLSAKFVDGYVGFDINSSIKTVPKDKLRKDYATYLTKVAMEFLICHECAHIINGHCSYVNDKYGILKINEDINDEDSAYFALMQTLEMDADSFATNLAYFRAKRITKDAGQLSEFGKFIGQDLETYFTHWSFAIYLFFRLFGLEELNVSNAKKTTHPPPYTRVSMMIGNVVSIYLHYNLENKEILVKNIIDSTISAEHCFSSITNYESMPIVFLKNQILSLGYQKEIVDNWNNIRPLLEPYAFADLPKLAEKSD